ncbi:major type 1 subunit fimbrin (pilin) [Pseudomonas nitritireducens]|uniref:Major type 1 subunit fimbrin (Pilin) n=1 Tax=Pseudomonas nitroreducens TaxID=46680 RepID=A0A7W7P2L4_PSENT|nr:fimbrial protein [Pseudomonas nitritireducens]MBB4866048.1 major type 1 subunit fimbrin (pilin) [Pseudomonas nitritireducens]
MKKLLAIVLLASSSSAVFAAPDAQINITGKVIEGTCTIDGTGTGTKQIDVPLNSVMASAFTAPGAIDNGRKSFDIKLTNCPDATTTLKWDASANVDGATGTLKNTASGTNAQVQLFKSDGTTPVNLASDPGVSFTGTSQTFTYVAKYYAKTTPVTGGALSTYSYIYLTYQ